MSEVEILEKLAVSLGLRSVRHKKFAIPMIVMAGILLTVILIVGSYKMAAVHADAEIDFWKSVATEAEPEVCSLCEYGEAMTYHAPVLVNLSTGEVGEMRVYKSEKYGDTLELAPIQQTGTFAFVKCAGLTGQQDTCSHTFKIDIPREIETMNIGRFCCDCRVLLAETNNSGFAIVDCFDLGNMKAYNIENGAEYAIRDYTVSVNEETHNDQLSVTVCGNANNLIFID